MTEVKSLAGSDLSHASFLLGNLSGVNLTDVILKGTNFWKTDLSGVDFTVTSKTSYAGSLFLNAILSNSNFEGVDLSPEKIFVSTFENKAYAINLQGQDLVDNLFGSEGYPNMHLFSAEVSGNDLVVRWVLFNNFSNANLENANFKNADLELVYFHLANLTNADLSGTNLKKSLLSGHLTNANLQDADLTGADLTGAIYDQSTILKCTGHPVCVN